MPGQLQAFRDGALGQFDGPLQAYTDGVLGGPPGGSGDGSLQSYKDGSLGEFFRGPDGSGARYAFAGQRGMGEYFGQRGMGEYFAPRGMGEYFSPLRGLGEFFTSGLRGLGAAVNVSFDLRDPANLKEVKLAAAMTNMALTATEQGQQVYTPAYYESGIWEPEATAVWFGGSQMLATVSNVPSEELAIVAGDAATMYPSANGLRALAQYVGSLDPAGFGTAFPRLAAFASAASGAVTAPYFSITEKVRGEADRGPTMAAMKKMAFFGTGALVLVAGVMYAKKRKLRANRSRRRR
jgi:hypothetical protein